MAAAVTVTINGVDLLCDPDEINIGGRKRGSVQKCIDGTTVYQDRGFNAGDQVIQIRGRTHSLSIIQGLFAIYRSVGSSYAYTDFIGNNVTVVFTPGIESLSVRPIKGSSLGYEYQISLSVVSGSIMEAVG
jgi:hypothetical protein